MIGIYKLVFNNKYAYIGQSIDLNRRKKQHIYGMKTGKHHNKNIINAFIANGEPEFLILEQCSIDKLNEKELYYVNTETLELLNSAPITGTNDPDLILHHNKKYSKEQIINVAEMLASKTITFEEIEKATNVNRSTIAAISMGNAHNWLEEAIPETYLLITNLKGNRQKAKGKKYTDEQIYEILVYLGDPKLTLKEISEITEISVSVIQSISGQYAYLDLSKVYPVEYESMLKASKLRKHKEEVVVISPSGESYSVINRSEFARTHNLRKASFLDLCNKKILSYKGWVIQG